MWWWWHPLLTTPLTTTTTKYHVRERWGHDSTLLVILSWYLLVRFNSNSMVWLCILHRRCSGIYAQPRPLSSSRWTYISTSLGTGQGYLIRALECSHPSMAQMSAHKTISVILTHPWKPYPIYILDNSFSLYLGNNFLYCEAALWDAYKLMAVIL